MLLSLLAFFSPKKYLTSQLKATDSIVCIKRVCLNTNKSLDTSLTDIANKPQLSYRNSRLAYRGAKERNCCPTFLHHVSAATLTAKSKIIRVKSRDVCSPQHVTGILICSRGKSGKRQKRKLSALLTSSRLRVQQKNRG